MPYDTCMKCEKEQLEVRGCVMEGKSQRTKKITCDGALEDEEGRTSQMEGAACTKAQWCINSWPVSLDSMDPISHVATFKVYGNQVISLCVLVLTTSGRVATSFYHCARGLLSSPHSHIFLSANYVQGLCQVDSLRVSIIMLNNNNNKKDLVNT